MAGKWTEERRKAAAERCRAQKPWKKSTGPKTPEGKVRASLNAFKTGNHSLVMQPVRDILNINRLFLKQYQALHKLNFNLSPDEQRKQIELIRVKKALLDNAMKNHNIFEKKLNGDEKKAKI